MKKTLIILTSVVIAALFIGTSMTTAIARESAIGDISVEEEAQVIEEKAQVIEEVECVECAAAATQIEDVDDGEESLQSTTIEGGDPYCPDCFDIAQDILEFIPGYVAENFVWPNGEEGERYLGLIVDIIALHVQGAFQGNQEFGPIVDFSVTDLTNSVIDAVNEAIAEGAQTPAGKIFAAFVGALRGATNYFINLCGPEGGLLAAPASAPVTAPASAPASAPAAAQSARASASASAPAGSMSI